MRMLKSGIRLRQGSVLLVCGLGSRSLRDAGLSAWLNKMADGVRRLGTVCVGSFLLAEAGLLNGAVEAARRQLERSDRGFKQVASAAGFGNVDVMRGALVRLLGITPRRYREIGVQCREANRRYDTN